MATYVHSLLIETKMVMLFGNTFNSSYYKHLMGSSTQHFYDVVRIAKRIEQGIKSRRITERITEPMEKKTFVGKKRE